MATFLFRSRNMLAKAAPVMAGGAAAGLAMANSSSAQPAHAAAAPDFGANFAQGSAPTKIPLPNPGKFEEFVREGSAVLQANVFQGIRAEYQQGWVGVQSKQFVTGHNFTIGNPQIEGGGSYEFVTQLVKDNHILMGNVDHAGNVTARHIYDGSPFSLHSVFQLSPDPSQNVSTFDLAYKGSDFIGQVKYAPSFYKGLSYSQSVSQTVALGLDLQHIDQQGKTIMTYGGRYQSKDKSDTVSGIFTNLGTVQLSYARKIDQALTFATEFQFHVGNRQSLAKVGYKLTKNTFQCQGTIDSEGKVAGVLDKMLNEVIKMGFCAELDQTSGETKLGLSLSISV